MAHKKRDRAPYLRLGGATCSVHLGIKLGDKRVLLLFAKGEAKSKAQQWPLTQWAR